LQIVPFFAEGVLLTAARWTLSTPLVSSVFNFAVGVPSHGLSPA